MKNLTVVPLSAGGREALHDLDLGRLPCVDARAAGARHAKQGCALLHPPRGPPESLGQALDVVGGQRDGLGRTAKALEVDGDADVSLLARVPTAVVCFY